MWHDWWMAHRIEVYGAVIFAPVICGIAAFVGWMDARRDRKK